MEPTLHERTLRRAVAYLGGADELASFLGVELFEVVSWLERRARLPEEIFLRLVDIVLDPELSGAFAFRARLADGDLPVEERSSAAGTALQFRIGRVVARCPSCDGIDFQAVPQEERVGVVNRVRCQYCSREMPEGDLIVLAGQEAVQRSSAAIAALKRRQQQMAERAVPAKPKKTNS